MLTTRGNTIKLSSGATIVLTDEGVLWIQEPGGFGAMVSMLPEEIRQLGKAAHALADIGGGG